MGCSLVFACILYKGGNPIASYFVNSATMHPSKTQLVLKLLNGLCKLLGTRSWGGGVALQVRGQFCKPWCSGLQIK